MTAFAANSLLARAALAGNAIDAGSFTAIRILSGALALAALLLARDRRNPLRPLPGRWLSAIALLVYALAFSLAYLRLSTAAGALILFAAVQGSMICWGVLHRDRPTPAELAGLAVAFGGFVYLLLPGLGTPDLQGSLLMMVSGIAWGAYSLVGGQLPARRAVLPASGCVVAMGRPCQRRRDRARHNLRRRDLGAGLRRLVPHHPAPQHDAGCHGATHRSHSRRDRRGCFPDRNLDPAPGGRSDLRAGRGRVHHSASPAAWLSRQT